MGGDKGTYGLFAHETVTHGVLLAPHREQTIVRMQAYAGTGRPRQQLCGIDPLSEHGGSRSDRNGETGNIGLVMHSAFVLTEQGMGLGTIHQSVWARPEPSEPLSEKERQARPIEEKESYKWPVALAETPKLPGTEVDNDL